MSRSKRSRRRAGVTLIEIMVVLVIMSLIASGVGVMVIKMMDRARIDATNTRARTIQQVAMQYLLDKPSECPNVDALLRENMLDATTDPRDGWSHPFNIGCEGTAVHVRSAGSDGEFGTQDDLGF
jgi:general secretion pathway protein G